MNSIGGREWEIYNLEQMGVSTEYDNILINKDIDNYFNNLISKPIINQNSNLNPFNTKSNYSFDKFYSDYVEHNLLFIVLLFGIVIFLIIRHYIKDFDTFETDLTKTKTKTENTENTENTNDNNSSLKKNKLKKLDIIKKKQQLEKIQLINYKKKLDMEKDKILTIIDELSNMNDYENSRLKTNQNYINQDINNQYSTNYSNIQKFYNQSDNNLSNLPHNLSDNSHYYNINKNINDDANKIDGLYIEPPFN